MCPVDLELFKWCDYLGQYVLSGYSVCPLILRITELFSTPVSVFLAAGCLKSVRTAFPLQEPRLDFFFLSGQDLDVLPLDGYHF